uniref:Uncharacterized protein n=1 Tax=Anguilla anguilla TaxID=7936 RepID=A0A0E9QFA5_ANGAN
MKTRSSKSVNSAALSLNFPQTNTLPPAVEMVIWSMAVVKVKYETGGIEIKRRKPKQAQSHPHVVGQNKYSV